MWLPHLNFVYFWDSLIFPTRKAVPKNPFRSVRKYNFFWVFCILLPACQRVMDNDTWLANVKVGPFSISERSEILQPILESTCLKIASSYFFPKKICHFKTRLKRLVIFSYVYFPSSRRYMKIRFALSISLPDTWVKFHFLSKMLENWIVLILVVSMYHSR